MKPANVVMLPVFLLLLAVPRLEAIAQSETDTQPATKTVTVRLGDPRAATAADIRNLADEIRKQTPMPFRDGLRYFFYEVASVCLAADAAPELRQAYLEEGRKIFLHTGYKDNGYLEGVDAFFKPTFIDTPADVLYGGNLTANEILPGIRGLSDMMISDYAAGNSVYRCDEVLGWYGIGENLYMRAYGNEADNRQLYQAFTEELAAAAAKGIALEKVLNRSGITASQLNINTVRTFFNGANLRLEYPATLMLRLDIIDYLDHRYASDNYRTRGSANPSVAELQRLAALEYGWLMLLGVQGDDRFAASVYSYLALGPGYYGGHYDPLYAYAVELAHDDEAEEATRFDLPAVTAALNEKIRRLEVAGWQSARLQEIKAQVPQIAARVERGSFVIAPIRVAKFSDARAEANLPHSVAGAATQVGEW